MGQGGRAVTADAFQQAVLDALNRFGARMDAQQEYIDRSHAETRAHFDKVMDEHTQQEMGELARVSEALERVGERLDEHEEQIEEHDRMLHPEDEPSLPMQVREVRHDVDAVKGVGRAVGISIPLIAAVVGILAGIHVL